MIKKEKKKAFKKFEILLANNREDYERILNVLKDALGKEKENSLVDYTYYPTINGNDDTEYINVWKPLEFTFTIKQFCNICGIY